MGSAAEVLDIELVEATEWVPSSQVVKYEVTRSELKEKLSGFGGLSFDTPENDAKARKAIAAMVSLRTGIEEDRETLNKKPLEFQRAMNAEAKLLTAMIKAVEEPLVLERKKVDAEKERVRAEKVAIAKAEAEAEARREREAEEARLKAIRDAEQAKIDADRAELEAERAKLAKERAEREEDERVARNAREAAERTAKEAADAAERAAKAVRDEAERVEREAREATQKAEQGRLDAIAKQQAEDRRQLDEERAAIAAERERLAKVEADRLAAIAAEAERVARVERERVAAEEAARVEAERVAALKAKAEALRPDAVKLAAFAGALRSVERPQPTSVEAANALRAAEEVLDDVTLALDAFGSDLATGEK